jgi:hypothetical protein
VLREGCASAGDQGLKRGRADQEVELVVPDQAVQKLVGGNELLCTPELRDLLGVDAVEERSEWRRWVVFLLGTIGALCGA